MNTPSIRKFHAAVVTAILAVVSLAPASHAQDHKLGGTVNVPFAFEAGGQHFAPGSYTIRMETPDLVLIKGASRSGFVMAQKGGGWQPAKKSKIVFQRSGARYFLSEIWIAEEDGHQEILQSKAERRLLLAGQKFASTQMELALLETAP